MLHAGKYLNVIRECGRLDIKNPYEDLTSNDGFSFSKVAVENMISNEQAVPGRDIAMNDETNEERKVDMPQATLIDTSGQ